MLVLQYYKTTSSRDLWHKAYLVFQVLSLTIIWFCLLNVFPTFNEIFKTLGSFYTADKMGWGRRKIRLIECNAKCRYLKNWPVKGLCCRCFVCLRPPPLLWPHSPPLTHCTVYLYLTQCTYSHRVRGGELTREKIRGAMLHKAGRKYQHDWLHLQSIDFIKHK